jgi:uncharacterized phage protein (TIGR01671 family)
MREIKFRGWNTVKKVMFSAETMAEDQLTLLPTGQFINVDSQSPRLSQIYTAHKIIPLQFTGLKDENGKEIYEGDIVKYDTEDGIVTATVIYYEEENESNWISGFVFKPFKMTDYTRDEPNKLEVIGNIYKNPELGR